MQWEVSRGGARVEMVVTPRVESDGGERIARVGVGFVPFEHVLVRDEPLAALRHGAVQTWRTASGSLRMFGRMLVGQASLKNLSGPLTIADVASKSASLGLASFVSFLAFVSVSLGVLNLLPVPMLDGGTLLYYLLEGLTGRPVSELWRTRLQYGGLLAIVLLMSIALSNDLVRLLGQQ
jgi:regulator of sigma E protease